MDPRFTALSLSLLVFRISLAVECPPGFIPGIQGPQGGCYYLETIETLSWDEAQNACQNKGGYLAELRTWTEMSAVRQLLTQLHPTCPFGLWIGASEDESTFEDNYRWAHSGIRVFEHDWYPGFPTPRPTEKEAIAMYCSYQYAWADDLKTNRKNFLCEAEAYPIEPSSSIRPPATCPTPYFHLEDRCYYIEDVEAKTWHQAKAECEGRLQGHLAELSTPHENRMVKHFLNLFIYRCEHWQNTPYLWIGGLEETEDSFYRWANSGTAVSNFDWADGEPTYDVKEEAIALACHSAYHWHDIETAVTAYYLCETDPS